MPAKLELIRIPRSQARKTKEIREQIRKAYQDLGNDIVRVANADVAAWQDKPQFKVEVKVTKGKYSLIVKYDARTVGGKHYRWVDKGTASYREKGGGRKPYPIRSKKPTGMISYDLPSPMPKTMAADGTLAHSYTDPPGTVKAKQVMHPGIKPRKFMEDYIKFLNSRKSGSFHNTTEAAIKRGLRRMRVMGAAAKTRNVF